MNLIIVLFIAAALVILLWRASKGPSRSFEELKQSIQDLYESGYDGGLLTISRLSGKKFIQLRKYALKNESGIEIIIPNAKWSASIFPAVEHALKEKKIPYEISGSPEEMSHLHIDGGDDLDKLWQYFNRVSKIVFGDLDRGKFYVLLEGAALPE